MKPALRKRLGYLAEWLGIWALVFVTVWQFASVVWLTWVIGFAAAIITLQMVSAFWGNEARLRSMIKRRAEIEEPSHRISAQKAQHTAEGSP